MNLIINETRIKIPMILLLMTALVLFFYLGKQSSPRYEGVLKLSSDRSISALSRCIDLASESFRPRLTRIAFCPRGHRLKGYCASGSTFIAKGGNIRVTTKLVDDRSEIWISYTGELSRSAIDAATQCQ